MTTASIPSPRAFPVPTDRDKFHSQISDNTYNHSSEMLWPALMDNNNHNNQQMVRSLVNSTILINSSLISIQYHHRSLFRTDQGHTLMQRQASPYSTSDSTSGSRTRTGTKTTFTTVNSHTATVLLFTAPHHPRTQTQTRTRLSAATSRTSTT